MMHHIVSFSFLALLSSMVYSHSYHFSRCPRMETAPDLDITRILGVWYGIEKTSTTVECLVYNIVYDEKDNSYKLQQEKYSAHSKTHTTASDAKLKLTHQNSSTPMRIKFQTNFFGSSSFVILTTDYTNYAGIFTCQSFGLFHRLSAVVLSRKRTLDQTYFDEIYQVLTTHNISTSDLIHIRQRGCARSRFQT